MFFGAGNPCKNDYTFLKSNRHVACLKYMIWARQGYLWLWEKSVQWPPQISSGDKEELCKHGQRGEKAHADFTNSANIDIRTGKCTPRDC